MVSISSELYTDRKGRVCRTEGGEHKPSVIYGIRAKPTGLSASSSKRRTPPRRLQMKPDLPVVYSAGSLLAREISYREFRRWICGCRTVTVTVFVAVVVQARNNWIDSS